MAVVDGAEGHVLDDGGQEKGVVRILPEEADPAAHPPRPADRHLLATDPHDARPVEQADDPQEERRLARAVRAEEPRPPPGGEREGHRRRRVAVAARVAVAHRLDV